MALASCPARQGQRSLRRMRQVLAGRWRARPGMAAGRERGWRLLRGGLVSSPVGGKDVVTGAAVGLVTLDRWLDDASLIYL
jgi:hypothetical protein